MEEKSKYTLNYFLESKFFILTVVFLLTTIFFALGRLSILQGEKEPIKVWNNNPATAALPDVSKEKSGSEKVIASKNGTKYHYPWCAGAKQISKKNKITFESIEEAKKAGYSPASNCKGLK